MNSGMHNPALKFLIQISLPGFPLSPTPSSYSSSRESLKELMFPALGDLAHSYLPCLFLSLSIRSFPFFQALVSSTPSCFLKRKCSLTFQAGISCPHPYILSAPPCLRRAASLPLHEVRQSLQAEHSWPQVW